MQHPHRLYALLVRGDRRPLLHHIHPGQRKADRDLILHRHKRGHDAFVLGPGGALGKDGARHIHPRRDHDTHHRHIDGLREAGVRREREEESAVLTDGIGVLLQFFNEDAEGVILIVETLF